jgi:ABC-type transporter Mla subunit MlaD
MKSMNEASASYSELVDKAGTFSRISADLSGLLSGLETQKQQLTGALKALADLLASVSGNLPQIEARVFELTNQLSHAVRHNQQEVNKTLAENSLLMRTSARDTVDQIKSGVAEQQELWAKVGDGMKG